ncbi:MAG: response regulator transcription factor [Actinobacteria bacterium]|nr:response regulator transcription factor [Actinomycetota bacterium]
MPVSSPPLGSAIRVLLADDHRLFAESLMRVLSEDERVDVVGIAENGEQAVDLALELQPDVILMDLMMPVMDGLEATRRIRGSGLHSQILLLTGTETPVGPDDATGATAFLRKERSVEELRQVFLQVASLAALLGAPAR